MDQKPDFFSAMPPKPSFLFGLVSGAAVVSVIGFGLVVTGGFQRLKAADVGNPTIAVAPTPSPQPQPQPEQPVGDPPPVTDKDHIRGDKNAKVTLIEYSDYECPFCKRFHPTMQQALQEYDGKVRWVYRHYPLNFHANAQKEAEASECANELGGNDAFWAYSDKIFELTQSNGTGLPLTSLVPMAKELGLDETKFKTCLDSGKYAVHVQDDMDGGAKAGVSGTPGTIVVDASGNAQLVSGAVPYSSLKAAIDAALR